MRSYIAVTALALIEIHSTTAVAAIVQTYTAPHRIANAGQANLAVIGNKLVVGAPYSSPNGDSLAGALYIFDAETGALVHEVLNPAYAGSNEWHCRRRKSLQRNR